MLTLGCNLGVFLYLVVILSVDSKISQLVSNELNGAALHQIWPPASAGTAARQHQRLWALWACPSGLRREAVQFFDGLSKLRALQGTQREAAQIMGLVSQFKSI